eukprot:TRINITY_DN11997_c0_g1_i1.p2 TRINITY_DN11997_c0_g1~~TRINITY_DN11997_c0_g1_i1.p2  ORF type:complete len:190 (+),score=41.29 TRINITY_DN11997_c0_g1_i1:135-704(+)
MCAPLITTDHFKTYNLHMKVFPLLFFARLVISSDFTVAVGGRKDDMSGTDLRDRAKFVQEFSRAPQLESKVTDNNEAFVVKIKGPRADVAVKSLDLSVAGRNSLRNAVRPPSFERIDEGVFTIFVVKYRVDQLTEKYGCRDTKRNEKQCKLELHFIATELEMDVAELDVDIDVKLSEDSRRILEVHCHK